MPNLTTNYQLEKPLETENYDINVHNRNMDKLDAKVKEVDAKVDNVKNEVSSMEFTSTKVIRPNQQTVEESLVANETSILNQGKEIDSLKSSVSSGKGLVANAITDKGVPTLATDTFLTMSDNISNIVKGVTCTAGYGTLVDAHPRPIYSNTPSLVSLLNILTFKVPFIGSVRINFEGFSNNASYFMKLVITHKRGSSTIREQETSLNHTTNRVYSYDFSDLQVNDTIAIKMVNTKPENGGYCNSCTLSGVLK